MINSNNIHTYITYFDDHQIEEYNLKEDEYTTLFKGNDTSYEGENINYLNIFYCELCTMYYVWKNNLKSDYVCFKQYRRPFEWQQANKLPESGEVICYKNITTFYPVLIQYAMCHGKKRANELINILKNIYGENSFVCEYFTRNYKMFTNNTMLLRWDDFVKMCEFVFGVIDKLDKSYKLNYKYERYALNAKQHTEDGRFDYQMHWMAYIGERLVSCYIQTYMKPLMIPRLENNGFFKPYKPKAGN